MSTRQRDLALDAGLAATGVDQLVFQPDGLGALRLVATSFDLADPADRWAPVLEPYLRRLAAPSGARGPALTYMQFAPGLAAVLCRRAGAGSGHGHVHGLLGPAVTLTSTVAVGLARWPDWLDEQVRSAQMPRLRPAQLDPDQGTAATLRSSALEYDEQLARVIAWLLQAPGRPLGIVGCPEAGRSGLLWGLVQIAAPLFEQRTWTFTTDDVPPEDAGDPLLPEIVFLTHRPDDAVPARTIVDLTRDQGASPENEYRANALVYRYEFGVEPGAAAPIAAATPPEAPADVPVAAVSPHPHPHPAVTAVTNGAGAALPPPAVPTGDAPLALPAPQRSTGHWDALRDAVDDLGSARSQHDVRAALQAVARHLLRPDDRAVVRAGLAHQGWGLDVVRRRVPGADQDTVLEQIVQLAFGDRIDDLDEARELAGTAESDRLVHALARVAWRNGRLDALAPAIAGRAARAPDPDDANVGPLGRLIARAGVPLSRKEERLLQFVLVAVAIAVIVSFLIGIAVGSLDMLGSTGGGRP
jgi:hypothetical protein